MAEKKAQEKNEKKDRALHVQVMKQMVTLSTSGFGLVAALAWNNVIREFIDKYIAKWLPNGGSLFSLLLYAVVITVIAVLVTINLTRITERLEKDKE